MALCLLAAAVGVVDGLHDFGAIGPGTALRLPVVGGSQAAAITLISARLTAAMLPAAFIWFRASRIARGMVGFFALIKVGAAIYTASLMGAAHLLDPLKSAALLIGTVAAVLLFVPSANRWFADRGPPVASAFA